MRNCLTQKIVFLVILLTTPAVAADWPMWRCDASRRASTSEQLPGRMQLGWSRSFGQRQPVWDDPLNRDLMPYDRVFEPVVGGNRMFVGHNDSDKLVAIDTDSGEILWSFYANGPVRFSPVFGGESVYFVSDDGCLYCLEASSGIQRWKFRGGPSEQLLIGNERLISKWPARGGPVLDGGRIYFSASIWPFMGTFIYCLDAASGEVIWENDHTGSEFILQPHNSPAFAGIAPQGALAVADDGLLVPGGRSVPALFERENGSLRYYHLAAQNKTGGSFVCTDGQVFFNHNRDQICSLYDFQTGILLVPRMGKRPVFGEREVYLGGESIRAYDTVKLKKEVRWLLDGNIIVRWLAGIDPEDLWPGFLGKMLDWWKDRQVESWRKSLVWEIEADATGDLIRAGDYLYAAGKSGITAIELGESPKVAWREAVAGGVERLLAASGKLFAVTLDGRIMAFGADYKMPSVINSSENSAVLNLRAESKALEIIRSTGVRDGYAVVCGITDGSLLEALVRNTDLRIVALDEDSSRVEAARRRLDSAGLYGKRAAVLRGSPEKFDLPPYMASLLVVNERAGTLPVNLLNSLRPYGGKAWIEKPGPGIRQLVREASEREVNLVRLSGGRGAEVLTRDGPLPGTAAWTHQYGSPANTVKSDDRLVMLPLGLLWFGGNSNLDVLPRHGHGPPEQVIGGRLFIEGMDCLSARDVYTGRVLWKVDLELDNFGIYFDDTYRDTPTSTAYNQVHIPGANIRGTNFIATADRLYVVESGGCRVLDAVSGETLDKFSLPAADDGAPAEWGYIGVWENYLIAGSGFVPFSQQFPSVDEENKGRNDAFMNYDWSASRVINVLDRYSGELLWARESSHGFLHNAIAAGGGRIFCLDKLPPMMEARLQRRGLELSTENSLAALDIASGKLLWERSAGVFGSWLAFSEDRGLLLQSTRPSSDMVRGENGRRMAVLQSSSGEVLWDREIEYSSVPILHGEKIITMGKIFDLTTGDQLILNHPLTGEPMPLTWKRNYGCNYPIASEHLLTFRSAAAGFYDLDRYGGTGNMGGFKSGCTSNLIAADGVLNAPDFTRTCACSYQNQTSLAMIHEPGAEYWTFNDIERGSEPIRQLGLNFGAPGDRMADDGTLWLDYPNRGGPSPDIPVRVEGEGVSYFCHHSSRAEGSELNWVLSSGVEAAQRIVISLADAPSAARAYEVTLLFSDCGDPSQPAGRFDVFVQGEKMVDGLDLQSTIGQKLSTAVKKLENVIADRELEIILSAADQRTKSNTALCGVQIIAQGW
ncbi:PQQ-binding-like beta-propeller repeat protein [Gemmatimonadota bacterium]